MHHTMHVLNVKLPIVLLRFIQRNSKALTMTRLNYSDLGLHVK